MKLSARVLVAAIAVVGLTLSGCSSDDSSGNGGSGGGEDRDFRVAVLTPGTSNDGSWGQAVANGANAAKDDLGVEVTVAENLNDTAQYQQQGNAFAAQGFDLIINANASMVDVTTDLAEKYPDVKFGQIGYIDGPAENVRAVTPMFWQGTFAAGYLAGLMSETGTVGTIGGFEFPLLTSEMEGFALGARYANPDIKVERQYINTWTDAGIGESASAAMVGKGADIIFSATDQATQGIFKTMQGKTDHYVIAQYLDKHEQAPDVVLTSVLYGLDDITNQFVVDAYEDTWENENLDVTLAEGISLAPFGALDGDVPDDVKTQLDQVIAQVGSGEIELPGIDVLGVTGSADDVDLATIQP